MQTNTPFRRAVQLSSRVTDYQTHVCRSARSECLVLIKSTIVRSLRATSSSLCLFERVLPSGSRSAASRRYASGARAYCRECRRCVPCPDIFDRSESCLFTARLDFYDSHRLDMRNRRPYPVVLRLRSSYAFSSHEAGSTRTRSGPSSTFSTAPRSSRAHRLRPRRGSHCAHASPRRRRDGREPQGDLARRV